MRAQVVFNREDERLIRDGYEAKHGKALAESTDLLHYYAIPEYIKLGKKVRRRKAIGEFFETWGMVIFWVVVIGGGVAWGTISNSAKHSGSSSSSYSTSSHSSKSGITYDDVCPITTCNDGACSSSTGRGTCSHHGGVRY